MGWSEYVCLRCTGTSSSSGVCGRMVAVLFVVLPFLVQVSSYKLHKILWTTDDNLFTRPFLPTLQATMGDAIDFLCPRLGASQTGLSSDAQENYLMSNFDIYKVSEEGYMSCNVTSRQLILRCDRPSTQRKFTIDIVEYNAIPNSIEFRCGEIHHFVAKERGAVSASTMCKLYNTRLRMNITCVEYEEFEVPLLGTVKSTEYRIVTQTTLLATPETPLGGQRNLYIIIGAGAGFIFITCFVIVILISLMIYRNKKEKKEQQRKDSLKSTITVVRNQPSTESSYYSTPEHYYYTINPDHVHDDTNSSGIYSYISE